MQTQEPSTQPISTDLPIREQLIQETEEISDDLLKEVLDFLLFIKARHINLPSKPIASEVPFSSAKYVLDNLSNIEKRAGDDSGECLKPVSTPSYRPASGKSLEDYQGGWAGDDFEECLQLVYDSRSKVNFVKHEPL
ncbi:MAG: hypothetical protein DCF22_19595 [Leptolyngbya sp.]|nr:MAG: hypothetical protein DCF22_19595 [Leptolyngbya sp.]